MTRPRAPNVHRFRTAERGSYLLESLIAILLFAFGILGLVGLLGSSVRVTNDARYRSEAANLASSMIAEMWTTTGNLSQLDANYGSSGSKIEGWQTKAKALLPSSGADPLTVELTPGLSSESRTVVVTVSWQIPGETEVHRHKMSAQIGKNRGATWP